MCFIKGEYRGWWLVYFLMQIIEWGEEDSSDTTYMEQSMIARVSGYVDVLIKAESAVYRILLLNSVLTLLIVL